MNIPIETVVELLVENAAPAKCGGGQIRLGGELYDSLQVDQLRGYIRTYLQSLVPPPKLLSECEEFTYMACQYQPGINVMREGEFAYEPDGTCGGLAKDFQVFQPVQPVEVK